MVLPLIPLAVIAVGAVTGGGGLALSGKGALDLKKARDELLNSINAGVSAAKSALVC